MVIFGIGISVRIQRNTGYCKGMGGGTLQIGGNDNLFVRVHLEQTGGGTLQIKFLVYLIV
jgi:hypothetical protein